MLVVPIDEGADIGFELPDRGMKSSVKFSIFRAIEGRPLLFEPPGI
jgi:hypothetical protein